MVSGVTAVNGLRKLMAGRYGGDQLSFVLIILSITITLAGKFTSVPLLVTLSYVPLFAAMFRMFSKNIEKRRMENYKFAILISPIYSRFHKIQRRLIDSRTHKYFKCPTCHATLRVPRGKDKVMVTCPKCNAKFEKKT
jgi:hypothetical protein